MLTASESILTPIWSDHSFKWNWRTASHLLNRAGFGGTPEDIAALVRMGPHEAINHIVYYQSIPDDLPALEFGPLSHREFSNFREIRRFLRPLTKAQRREYFQLTVQAGFSKMQEMRCWWINRMVKTRRPLQEKMTLFWHGLFVSAFSSVNNAYHMYMQNQLFREFATGSAKVLTLNISRDPAMLRYLNNNQNRKGHANENYARELMELFTMGIGNYTEEDVRQSARAWTGWTFVGDHFVFRPFEHDDGEKTFLGHTGNFNGDDIVRIIFQQPATAKHFAFKLSAFFTSDDPPPEIVDALAQKLRESDWRMAPVLEQLFSSRWFFSDAVMRRKIKSPMELVAGSFRALNVPAPNANGMLYSMKSMGQELFEAPNVGGWPHGRAWINTSTLFARYDMPAALVTGRRPSHARSSAWNQPHSALLTEFQTSFSPELDLARAGIATTDGAVDYFLNRLIADEIEPAKRSDLIRVLNGSDSTDSRPLNTADGSTHWRLLELVELIMAMPEYQLC